MFRSPSGKKKKKFKDEDAPSNGSNGYSAGTSSGLFSRRSKHTQTTSGSPLLPTYADASSPTRGTPGSPFLGPSSQRTSRKNRRRPGGGGAAPHGAESPCSSFVFGGMHHHGKDRRPRRRKTLCHRVFLSTPGRVVATSIVIAYCGVRYVLSPLGSYLVSTIGRALATDHDGGGENGGGRSNEKWKKVAGLPLPLLDSELARDVLPPMDEMRRGEEALRQSFDDNGGKGARHGTLTADELEVLAGIAPKFAARNEHRGGSSGGGGEGGAGGGAGSSAGDHRRPSQDGSDEYDDGDGLITLETMETSGSCPPLPEGATPSVSLVMQSTVDRLWLLEETCRRWTDPIVLVVYHDAPPTPTVEGAAKAKGGAGDDEAERPWRDAVDFDWDVVCPQVHVVPFQRDPAEEAWRYPINELRNAGLDELRTTHFLVVDVDFVPSATLLSSITENLRYIPGDRDALVVPAFERAGEGADCSTVEECRGRIRDDPKFIPSSFEDLRDCVLTEKCIVFQSNNNWEGHFTTKSEVWLRGDWYDEEEVSPSGGRGGDEGKGGAAGTGSVVSRPRNIPCFHSYRYEPYVVLRWCDGVTPYYDERFYGYGKNKIEYVSHLRFLHYTFRVLPKGYIVHHPHPESKAKESWNDRDGFDLHVKMDELYPVFLNELYEMHGKPQILQCKRKKKKTVE